MLIIPKFKCYYILFLNIIFLSTLSYVVENFDLTNKLVIYLYIAFLILDFIISSVIIEYTTKNRDLFLLNIFLIFASSINVFASFFTEENHLIEAMIYLFILKILSPAIFLISINKIDNNLKEFNKLYLSSYFLLFTLQLLVINLSNPHIINQLFIIFIYLIGYFSLIFYEYLLLKKIKILYFMINIGLFFIFVAFSTLGNIYCIIAFMVINIIYYLSRRIIYKKSEL